jgi:hypothetical protein
VTASDVEPIANTKSAIDCVSPPHPGNPKCTGWRNIYYFNARTRSCELFTYAGCGGNNNRYAAIFDLSKEEKKEKSQK